MKNWYTATPEEVAMEVLRRKRIPSTEFKVVQDWATIPTADYIVTRPTSQGRYEYLLGRRIQDPWRGEFMVFGGKIPPGQTPDRAVREKCMDELGFRPKLVEFRGHLSVFNPSRSSGGNEPWFSLWNLYTIPISMGTIYAPNYENSELRWFTCVDPALPEPARKALRMVGCPAKST